MSKYEVWLATHAAGVSGNARVLLAHYIQHSWFDAAHRPKGSNAPRGVSYWSKSALAKCLNMTPKTIYNSNQALTDAGFISVTNRYREGDKGSGGIVTGLAHDRNPSDLPRLQAALASIYGWEAAQGLTLEAIPARCITMGKARAWVQSYDGLALPAAPWAENTTSEIAGQSHSDKPASAWNELVPSLGRPEQDPGQGSPSPVAAAPSTTEETAGDILHVAAGGQGHHNHPAAANPTATAEPEAPAHQPTGDTYQPIEPIPGQIDVYEALDEIALHPAA